MATFERRVSKSGDVTWRAKIRLRGVSASETFERKSDAKDWASKAEASIRKGEYGEPSKQGLTVAELIDRCIAEHLPTKRANKSRDKVATQLAWWKDELGRLTLSQLTPARIHEARGKLLKRRTRHKRPLTSATVNRYLAALSVACKYGWKVLRVLPGNPVLSVEKGSESAGVVRFLSDNERAQLLQAASADPDANMHTAIVLALATGLRAGNLRALEWSDVDFDRQALRVRDSKNGTARWVPMIDPALRALRLHRQRDPIEFGPVFRSPTQDKPAEINGAAWMRVKRAAGLVGAANFRFHDLRHTAGTYLNEAGASDIAIAAVLGHKTLAMAKRYSHQSPEFTRATLAKLAERVK
jgi:integrase